MYPSKRGRWFVVLRSEKRWDIDSMNDEPFDGGRIRREWNKPYCQSSDT